MYSFPLAPIFMLHSLFKYENWCLSISQVLERIRVLGTFLVVLHETNEKFAVCQYSMPCFLFKWSLCQLRKYYKDKTFYAYLLKFYLKPMRHLHLRQNFMSYSLYKHENWILCQFDKFHSQWVRVLCTFLVVLHEKFAVCQYPMIMQLFKTFRTLDLFLHYFSIISRHTTLP